MSVVWQALWFIVAVSVLVTVHEFGHYWVARRLGFKVLRFSVGFGKPLLSRVAGPDRTEYVIASIPLGGYVKMLDEREGPVPAADLHRSFTRKPPWQRILVLVAGPAFNILFAIVVLWGMFWWTGADEAKPIVGEVAANSVAAHAGLRSGDEIKSINGAPVAGQRDVVFDLLDAMSSRGDAALSVRGADGGTRVAALSVPDSTQRVHLTEPAELFKGLGFEFSVPPIPPVLGVVTADGPAARAGLKTGDRIVSIGGTPINDFRDIANRIKTHPGESLDVTYRRGGVDQTVEVRVASDDGGDGKLIGRIKVAQPPVTLPDSFFVHTDFTLTGALGRATEEAWSLTLIQGRLVGRMLTGHVSVKNLSGPLSIAEYAGESADAGAASFLEFLVLISLSLGFLNMLPIPILDGGQIVFQAVEWLKGSPLSERAQAFSTQVGIALLILLMGVALFNDIARQFS
ncbi:MAG TPA: RIP metalloprotease RseP [Steroidobacteraceae bacterium]|nr:RIP metalloprotease RseP [Steroidobacteraceae bacterium]